jgi:hypothetical protein
VSARAAANAELLVEIREIHEASRRTYGARRIKGQLRHRGIRASPIPADPRDLRGGTQPRSRTNGNPPRHAGPPPRRTMRQPRQRGFVGGGEGISTPGCSRARDKQGLSVTWGNKQKPALGRHSASRPSPSSWVVCVLLMTERGQPRFSLSIRCQRSRAPASARPPSPSRRLG